MIPFTDRINQSVRKLDPEAPSPSEGGGCRRTLLRRSMLFVDTCCFGGRLLVIRGSPLPVSGRVLSWLLVFVWRRSFRLRFLVRCSLVRCTLCCVLLRPIDSSIAPLFRSVAPDRLFGLLYLCACDRLFDLSWPSSTPTVDLAVVGGVPFGLVLFLFLSFGL